MSAETDILRRRQGLHQLLLLDLMVYDVSGGQLAVDILHRNAHLSHQNHDVIGQIRDFVDSLLFIVALGTDDDLGAHSFLDNCTSQSSNLSWQWLFSLLHDPKAQC